MGATVLALALPVGCQAPPAATGPTQTSLRFADRDAFLDEALSLLRRCDLPPERIDRDQGLIVTQRTTSAQWFEPWRVDARGGYQLLESSLHTVARVVTISVEPDPTATEPATTGAACSPTSQESPGTSNPVGPYRVTVRADKFRFSGPERQITTPSGAMAVYSENTPTMEGQRGTASADVRWVPLGRDTLLEEFLMAQLRQVAPESR